MKSTRRSSGTPPAARRIRRLAALLLAAGLCANAQASDIPGAGPEPATRGTDGPLAERGGAERRARESLEEFESPRMSPDGSKGAPAPAEHRAVSCCGFRVYDADTELFDDFDRDGYHSYLRVTFDVDTDYAEAEVFADVWLRRPYGEYVLVHESDVFTIRGASAIDDYEVEVELIAGFPPGLYDMLIEIYDARDARFVADYDALDSSALGLLPLEDLSFDGKPAPPVVHAEGSGGSGAFSLAGLAVLAGLSVLRRRRHSSR
ncbi:MAG: choice-of-anchor H family protein [Gammaproteobacteria bacterium]